MKKYVAFLTLLFTFFPLYAQTNNILRGVLLYQNSDLTPAVGVRISGLGGVSSLDGANTIYTTDKGEFILIFSSKSVGDALKLSIGDADKNGQSIEVVNQKEVERCRIPSDPMDKFEIIVCKSGQLDLAMQRYYGILATTAKKELNRRVKEVDQLLAQTDLDRKTILRLINQKDSLQIGFNEQLTGFEEQALFIASINLDRANELVQEAVKMIDEKQDVEKALQILDYEKLADMHERNQQTIQKSEENIKTAREGERKIIEAYEFRNSLLLPQYKYKDAIVCYEKNNRNP